MHKFCKEIFANYFFADSKSRAEELSNDVSFVIFGHQTWDLEGGGVNSSPSVSWFSSTPGGIGLKTNEMHNKKSKPYFVRLWKKINEILFNV